MTMTTFELNQEQDEILNAIFSEIIDLFNKRADLLPGLPSVWIFQNIISNLLIQMFIDMARPGYEQIAYDDFISQFKSTFDKRLAEKKTH